MNTRDKSRLAVVVNDMNSYGGTQRVAANLVRDLGQCYDTRLLSVRPLHGPVFYEKGLRFESLNHNSGAGGRLRYIFELALLSRKLKRYITEKRIDTVLAIWYDLACITGIIRIDRVTKIGCEQMAFGEVPRFWRMMRRLSYRRLDAVVGLTVADRPALARVARTTVVIPNAVYTPSPVDAAKREKTLLCVGHLIPRKGLGRLLWTLQSVLRSHGDWQLAIIGGGSGHGFTDWAYLDHLATLVKLLQLEGRVVIHSATEDISAWYTRASIYVMGSRQAGLPMTLIEAKSFGLPIVSYDCPAGPREIIRHGVDGYLIDGDSDAFGSAVDNLISDPALWQRMSDEARNDVISRFSGEVVSRQWFTLIDSLHEFRNGTISRCEPD